MRRHLRGQAAMSISHCGVLPPRPVGWIQDLLHHWDSRNTSGVCSVSMRDWGGSAESVRSPHPNCDTHPCHQPPEETKGNTSGLDSLIQFGSKPLFLSPLAIFLVPAAFPFLLACQKSFPRALSCSCVVLVFWGEQRVPAPPKGVLLPPTLQLL